MIHKNAKGKGKRVKDNSPPRRNDTQRSRRARGLGSSRRATKPAPTWDPHARTRHAERRSDRSQAPQGPRRGFPDSTSRRTGHSPAPTRSPTCRTTRIHWLVSCPPGATGVRCYGSTTRSRRSARSAPRCFPLAPYTPTRLPSAAALPGLTDVNLDVHAPCRLASSSTSQFRDERVELFPSIHFPCHPNRHVT
jgi:hypothetical protein